MGGLVPVEVKALYTVEEIAEALRVHVTTIRRYIREEKLEAMRIGRKWMIPLSALTARPALWDSLKMADAYIDRT
jgi:excisionase family DNA binding protein